MSPTVYLVSGANRPDGFAFHAVLDFLARDSEAQVIVAARDPDAAVELQDIVQAHPGRLSTVKMDVSDLESVKAAFEEVAVLPVVKNHGVDVLWINGGVLINGGLTSSKVPGADIVASFNVNTLGAVYLAQTFLPLLRQGAQKKIVYTSSALGSTYLSYPATVPGSVAAYGLSKAAANHFFKRLSDELKPENFSVVAYHPGVVATSMNSGTKAGDKFGDITILSPEEAGILASNLITTWTAKDTGKFFNETGQEIPW